MRFYFSCNKRDKLIRKLKISILLSFAFILFASCGVDKVDDTTGGLGRVSFRIYKNNFPEGIKILRFNIKNGKSENKTAEFRVTENDPDVYTVDLPAPENYDIEILAEDAGGKLIFKGTDKTLIAKDIFTPILLQFENTDRRPGNVVIQYTWGSKINEWTDYPLNPIIQGSGSIYDSYGVSHPFVLKEEDRYLMWFKGLANDGISYIFCATSVNGFNWELILDGPVLKPGELGTWDCAATDCPVVIKEKGLYRMYYSGWVNQNGSWNVGTATSEDGKIWTKHDSPIILGDSTAWDFKISPHSIFKKDNKYYLFYSGKKKLLDHRIGIAISADGINWTKYKYNPVLVPSQYWEGSGVYFPSIIYEKDQYKMIYSNSSTESKSFGFAYSVDGLNWQKFNSNPVFSLSNTSGNFIQVSYPNLIDLGSEYRLYYSGLYPTKLNIFTINVAVLLK